MSSYHVSIHGRTTKKRSNRSWCTGSIFIRQPSAARSTLMACLMIASWQTTKCSTKHSHGPLIASWQTNKMCMVSAACPLQIQSKRSSFYLIRVRPLLHDGLAPRQLQRLVQQTDNAVSHRHPFSPNLSLAMLGITSSLASLEGQARQHPSHDPPPNQEGEVQGRPI
jgi:hypothetical protein